MENRVSIIGIIVENTDSVDRLNDILHDYGSYIIGRMGIPYKEKNLNVISIVLDAPLDIMPIIFMPYFTGLFKEIFRYIGCEVFNQILIFFFGKRCGFIEFVNQIFHFLEHTTFEVMPSSIPIFPESLLMTSNGASSTILMTLRFFSL